MPRPLPPRTRVSLVVPTHDTRDLTLRCLESIRAQAMEVETLVVDDASRDDTAQAVTVLFPEVRLLRQEEQRGFTASVNRGLNAATGEVMVALNSDSELVPGSLGFLLARFEEVERLGIAGGRLLFPDGTPQWSGGREPSLLWLFGLASGLPTLLGLLPGWRKLRPVSGTRDSWSVDWVTGAALAMRRAVWQAVGPFNSSYGFYGQDLDLCTRARAAGWAVEVVPGFQVIHHHGATIAQQPGTVARQAPARLWTDLVQWARRHRGEAWARRAALALRLGGRLRLLARWGCELVLPGRSRAAWRRDSLAYRRAVAMVSSRAPEPSQTGP